MLQLSGTASSVAAGAPDAGNLAFEWYAEEEGLANGAAVTQLTDQSGNSNHAMQGTGGNQGRFDTAQIGGKAAVWFDASDYYTFTSAIAPSSANWTIYAVWKIFTSAGGDGSLTGGGNNGVNYQMFLGSNPQPRLASAGVWVASGQTLTKNSWNQTNTSYTNPNGYDFRANKVQGNSGTSTSKTWANGIQRVGGNDVVDRPWHGWIAAMLIYTDDHDTATKQDVEDWLSDYFGGAI